jgi:hypothetical protein
MAIQRPEHNLCSAELFIRPLPRHSLHFTGYIPKPARGCATKGKPALLQAGQLCSVGAALIAVRIASGSSLSPAIGDGGMAGAASIAWSANLTYLRTFGSKAMKTIDTLKPGSTTKSRRIDQ